MNQIFCYICNMENSKTCTKCKISKELLEFGIHKKCKNGINSQCKECVNTYSKLDYEKNKEIKLKTSNIRAKKKREEFLEFKKTLKCMKCPESRWWVLEFHHRDPKEKEYTIGRHPLNRKKFDQELLKCDVLCANCHLDAHHKMRLKEKNSYEI